MNNFPDFMKNQVNAINEKYQSKGIEGYVYDGTDGNQMIIWECHINGESSEHTHDYDEYFVVLQGLYTLIIDGKKIPVKPGDEYFIPKGIPHAGLFVAGTRTIHAFGGKRAIRKNEKD